jgi:hypothetical protein
LVVVTLAMGDALVLGTASPATGVMPLVTGLVVLVAVVALLGLGGDPWSGREVRPRRDLDGIEPKGASS